MKLQKLLARAGVVVSAAALTAANANAAGGLDFSAVTAAVDATTIVAAIAAIAAIKVLPNVAKWGFNQVIHWFK